MSGILEIIFHPSCWDRNYKTNKDYDALIRKFIEHKDEVQFLWSDNFRVDLRYKNSVVSFWIVNKWYAYLATERMSVTVNGKPVVLYPRNVMPFRKTCFDFYRAFELPNIGKKGRFGVDMKDAERMIFEDKPEEEK